MIGMAVRAIRTEGDDDLRPDAMQVFRDLLLCALRRHGVHTAIGIAKHGDVMYAQFPGGGPQFPFARLPDDLIAGPIVAVQVSVAGL